MTPQVDLSTLSDAQLAAYGLPPHASVVQDIAHWTQIVRTATRVCLPAQPSHRHGHLLGDHVLSGGSCSAEPTTQCRNYEWAGNEANGSRGTYGKAEVTFNVANVSLANVGDIASSWAGVGGDTFWIGSSAVVVQAGVDAENVCCFGNQSNTSWIDVEPNLGGSRNLPLCRLSTGDQIYVEAESNFNGSGEDYFFIQNISAGCYNSCSIHTTNNNQQDTCGVTGGPSFNSDSATGECIVERLNAGLAQWNSPGHKLSQTGCRMNNTNIGSLSHHYNVIINASNQVLAGVSSLYNGGSAQDLIWYQTS